MWWRKRRPDILRDVPKLVIAYCVGTEKQQEHDLELLRGQLSGLDRSIALRELFALRMAAAIFVAQECIQSSVQPRMRKSFAATFHALLTETSTAHAADWLAPVLHVVQAALADSGKDPNAFIDFINDRAKRYITAYTSPHPSGTPLPAIGAAFSELCGVERGDPRVEIAAVVEFTGSLFMGATALQECQRLPGGDVITIDPNWKSPFL